MVQYDHCFFPVRPLAVKPSAAPHLSFDIGSANIQNFHIVQLFHSFPNLNLIGLPMNLERIGILRTGHMHSLLGYNRSNDNLIFVHVSHYLDNLVFFLTVQQR